MSYYDPRINKTVDETDNPILKIADLMIGLGYVDTIEKERFWNNVSILADYADEKMNGNGRKPKRIKVNTKTKSKLIEKKLVRKQLLNDKKTLVRQKILPNKAT